MQISKLIPRARHGGVRAALEAAFGTATTGQPRPIVGGVSGAMIFRFEVHERPYVLRLEPERISLSDRRRGFACMASAADARAAPPVRYADAESGVAIMDFIPGRPLSEHPGGSAGMARALGELIAQVQATTPFPTLGDYPQMIGTMLETLSGSGLFPPGQLEPHAEGLARISAALPWDAASLVSAHNDPNPRNLLFDGTRLWLIDWELAFRNDPMVDLAILTTDLVETPQLEDILLEAAFGRPPDPRQRARMSAIRLLTRLFYGCIVLEGFAAPPSGAANLPTFTPAGFRAAVADGRLASGAPETAYGFGQMSLAAFVDGLKTPRFSQELDRLKRG